MSARPRIPALLALGLATGCTLALQVVLTRLYSAVLAYHFSFLAISLSLLGTGSGALLLYLRPGWFSGAPERLLARWCAALALLLAVLPVAMVRLDLSGINELDLHFALNLAASCVIAALPSFASGVVVALAIDRYRSAMGAVYAFDLLGAGIGALLIVPVLWLVDAPTLVALLGLIAAGAAFLFVLGVQDARLERGVAAGVAAVTAVICILGSTTSLLFLDPRYAAAKDTAMVADRWTPIARVIGYGPLGNRTFANLFYDRVWAPVHVVPADESLTWRDLRTGPASIGYTLSGPGHALIIGGGGGRDIWTALSLAQNPVDVVELSAGNRIVVDEDLASFSRSPYSHERVRTVIGDGRSVLSARDTLYDQIHIGFTDTLSANSAQGFALTENNLYTVEAFLEYFDHLKPNGVLNVSRLLKLVGDEALRVTVLALAALEEAGVENPKHNVVVILGRDLLGPYTGTVLARKRPFTPREVTLIRALAKQRAAGVLYAPGGPYQGDWQRLAEAPDYRSFCRQHALNVCPPTDDQPFFFSMHRLSQMGAREGGYFYAADPVSVLMLTLLILMILSAVALGLPMALLRGEGRPAAGSLSYFAAIGLGFLLLEMTLIQRLVLFLGYPTYALSVVLFSLLVFSGVGSALSARFANPRRALLVDLALISLLTAAIAFGLQPLLRSMISLPFAARVCVAILLLLPIGTALGVAMPIGLQRLAALAPSGVPLAWGVNGFMSVLASVLGVAAAIHFGFTATTLLACGCYVFAFAHAAAGRWAEPDESPTLRGR